MSTNQPASIEANPAPRIELTETQLLAAKVDDLAKRVDAANMSKFGVTQWAGIWIRQAFGIIVVLFIAYVALSLLLGMAGIGSRLR